MLKTSLTTAALILLASSVFAGPECDKAKAFLDENREKIEALGEHQAGKIKHLASNVEMLCRRVLLDWQLHIK